jgi:biopolymer transport protein ExbB
MDYSLYWQHTDLLSKSLFGFLLVMSIVSWVTIVLRYLNTRQLIAQGSERLREAVYTLNLSAKHVSIEQRQAVAEQALLQQMGRVRLQTEQGLSVLGTIAAIAPFVGLFGTVWGIFHALHAIGVSGQAGLGQVAGPVGESLIMTGLGLAVAIPAVLGYNVCLRQNRRLMAQLQDAAHSILMQQILPNTIDKPVSASTPTHHKSSNLIGEVV